MSDEAILALHNDVLESQAEMVLEAGNKVVEVPPGKPQAEYVDYADQWAPRGELIRCLITDDENGVPHFWIDETKLSLEEFGRMLLTFNGWGMRIAFVHEAYLADEPEIEVRDPDRLER